MILYYNLKTHWILQVPFWGEKYLVRIVQWLYPNFIGWCNSICVVVKVICENRWPFDPGYPKWRNLGLKANWKHLKSMIFNINNHTSHSWMSFVNLHVGCISMLNHIQHGNPLETHFFIWTVNFGTMFTFLLIFVDTSIVFNSTPYIPHPFCQIWSNHSVAEIRWTKTNFSSPTPKPFINWGMKNTMVKPMNCRVEPQKHRRKKGTDWKHTSQQVTAPHAQVGGVWVFGWGVDWCFFHSNLFVGCGWRLKVCNKMHLNHLTSFSKIY